MTGTIPHPGGGEAAPGSCQAALGGKPHSLWRKRSVDLTGSVVTADVFRGSSAALTWEG